QCANCHEKMDAFGFTLENFDAIGEWRERDETGAQVDASAKISSNNRLDGVAGLQKYLLDHKADFTRCLTEKMLTYALDPGLDYSDDRTVERIQKALAAGGYKFSVLVEQIVKSPPFHERRGSVTPAVTKTLDR